MRAEIAHLGPYASRKFGEWYYREDKTEPPAPEHVRAARHLSALNAKATEDRSAVTPRGPADVIRLHVVCAIVLGIFEGECTDEELARARRFDAAPSRPKLRALRYLEDPS